MTDTPFRQALLEAVRAELIAHEQSEHSLPSTQELYRGYPFYRGALETDTVLWLKAHALPRLKNAKRVGRAVQALYRLNNNVSAEIAANAAEAAQSLLREGGVVPGVDIVLHDVYQRCSYVAWQAGFQYVASDVAACAYELAARSRETLHIVRYVQTAMTVLASSMTPGPQGQRDRNRGRERALTRIVGWGHYAKEVADAEKAAKIEDKEAIRQHVETAFRRLAKLDVGPALAEAGDIEPAGLDDADAFMLEPALPPVPAGPSLVVVPSLEHLPEKKYDRGAPRNEFGDLAGRALPLVRTPDLHEAAEILTSEFPWLSSVAVRVLETLIGREAVLVPPILLVGKPGCGKSALARRITDVLGLPRTEISCAGSADASLGGTSRQWSTGRANSALQVIKRTGVANPALILDELEKADPGRHNGSLLDVVLAMIEPGSRKAFHDPFLECPVDLSGVAFIACANDIRPLKGPLLDRFVVIECPDPTAEDLDTIVQGILRQVRADSGIDPRFVPPLDSTEYAVLRRGWKGGSIRPLVRAVNRLLALRSAPGLAH